MTLPSNFSSLTASEQIFVLANLERVDRGIAPIEGVASNLDSYAQIGADNGTDPPLPPNVSGGANWAGFGEGMNIFDAYALWMYEDGPGGNNADCTPQDSRGCWAHRSDILANYASPALMGGAVATRSGSGSIAELFVGDHSDDAPYFTWSDVTPNLPVGAWPTKFADSVPAPGMSSTNSLELWASGEAMKVGLSVHGGNGAFSVGAAGCDLSSGQSCHVAVTFAPKSAGSYSATLNVTGPNGTQVIPLSGKIGPGYWLVASDGGIFSFGDAQYSGSTGAMQLNKPIVGMAPNPDGGGYWLAASDGGIFSFGDAQFFGSTGAMHLNEPIVGMAPTPDGAGYRLVASDGGIFSFGDAGFFGSTGALHLNEPIVGMAPTPDGGGYWLVASDGGIFSFGDAVFFGSTGAKHLNEPIVGMAPTPDGGGYWLVASDGGIFSFGDAQFFGSTGAMRLNEPIVSVASTPDGGGYWLVASDGGIFSFGDAQFFGSTGGSQLKAPVVGIAPFGP